MDQSEMGKAAVEFSKQQRRRKIATCFVLSGWYATLFITDNLFGYHPAVRVDGALALVFLACAFGTAFMTSWKKRSLLGLSAIAGLLLISSTPLLFTVMGLPLSILLLRHVMTLFFCVMVAPYFLKPRGFAFFLVLLYNALCFYFPILRTRELDETMAYVIVTYSFSLLFAYFFLDILRMNLDHVSSLIAAKRDAEDRALRDDLTGVYNRRYCDNLLRVLIENETEKALLFIDLDDYQNVYQAHGHLVGDAYLKRSAEAISESIRSGDVVSRFSGNQFVVVLDSNDLTLAETVARSIIKAVGNVIPEFEGISVGVTKIIPGITQQAVLVNADTALYRSKRSHLVGISIVDPANPRIEPELWPETDMTPQ